MRSTAPMERIQGAMTILLSLDSSKSRHSHRYYCQYLPLQPQELAIDHHQYNRRLHRYFTEPRKHSREAMGAGARMSSQGARHREQTGVPIGLSLLPDRNNANTRRYLAVTEKGIKALLHNSVLSTSLLVWKDMARRHHPVSSTMIPGKQDPGLAKNYPRRLRSHNVP